MKNKLKIKFAVGGGILLTSILVPTVLTSCSKNNNPTDETESLLKFDNCYKTYGQLYTFQDINNTKKVFYQIVGQLNQSWVDKDFETVANELQLAKNDYGYCDFSYSNINMIKSLLSVGTIDIQKMPQEIQNKPEQKDNMLLSYGMKDDESLKDQTTNTNWSAEWISPNDINYNFINTLKPEINISGSGNDYLINIIFNQDQKYQWYDGTNYPIAFYLQPIIRYSS